MSIYVGEVPLLRKKYSPTGRLRVSVAGAVGQKKLTYKAATEVSMHFPKPTQHRKDVRPNFIKHLL